jgi:hypothetical protein
LSLILVEPLQFFKFQFSKKKGIFQSISDMGCFRVIKNSVQFQYECSILSPKDKMTKNESKTDFLHKISKDFVFIFSNISILVKLQPNEKAI